jgi:uroporphyrin-III C-methyltransferase/precorrin-2 dehydrogenase/sirohydrochlorin ferrochelatase
MNAPLRLPLPARLPRIASLARLPVFFDLHGRKAVVAGNGPAAAWKAELLSAAGASVSVYAPDSSDDLLNLGDGGVTVIRRRWTPHDLRGAALAVGDFDTGTDAGEFASAARAEGVPVNVIDKVDFCDFSFGAIVNRSPLVIGISTDGAAPALAQAIRSRIEAVFPQGVARWIAAAARWRPRVKSSGLAFEQRRRFWQMFAARSSERKTEPTDAELHRLLAVAGGIAAGQGSLDIVDVPGGEPDLLTLRAVRALQTADVVLFDDSISPEILEYARREARRVNLSALSSGRPTDENLVDDLLKRLRAGGAHVVHLKTAA